MRWVKREHIRTERPGIALDAQLNAVIAVNCGAEGQRRDSDSGDVSDRPPPAADGDQTRKPNPRED